MSNNFVIKVLVSYPVILIGLYFIPFVGVCLLLFRMFIYNRKRVRDLLFIIGIGLFILSVRFINYIVGDISYLSDIVSSSLYNNEFISYGKFLISVGIILLIVSYVVNIIFNRVSSKISSSLYNYISDIENNNREISVSNDMKMKEKRDKAINTNYVKCSNCGSDNLVSGKFGVCKYCRSKLVNNNYK